MRYSDLGVYTSAFFWCVVVFPRIFADKRNVFVNKLANCKGYEDARLQWNDVTLGRDPTSKDFVFSVKLKVLKEVSTKFGMEFNVWKCDAAGTLDSCEYFLKELRNDHICSYIAKKHQFWSVFIDRFDPKLECPIKPATYNVVNVPFTSDAMKFLPIQDSYWRARLKGFDGQETISCVELDIKVTTERRG